MRRTVAIALFALASVLLVLMSHMGGVSMLSFLLARLHIAPRLLPLLDGLPLAPFDWTEALGFTTGVLCVWMTAVEDVWNFPIGIINSAFYIVIFFRSALYADFGLFILYVLLGFHGWYLWLYGNRNREIGPNPEESGETALRVERADRRDLLNSVAVIVAGLPLWAFLRHVNGFAPFMDALLTVMSVVAQLMLNRKRLENWTVWIVADVLYVGLYAYKGLYLTAVLYAIYCALAVGGYRTWRKSLVRSGALIG